MNSTPENSESDRISILVFSYSMDEKAKVVDSRVFSGSNETSTKVKLDHIDKWKLWLSQNDSMFQELHAKMGLFHFFVASKNDVQLADSYSELLRSRLNRFAETSICEFFAVDGSTSIWVTNQGAELFDGEEFDFWRKDPLYQKPIIWAEQIPASVLTGKPEFDSLSSSVSRLSNEMKSKLIRLQAAILDRLGAGSDFEIPSSQALATSICQMFVVVVENFAQEFERWYSAIVKQKKHFKQIDLRKEKLADKSESQLKAILDQVKKEKAELDHLRNIWLQERAQPMLETLKAKLATGHLGGSQDDVKNDLAELKKIAFEYSRLMSSADVGEELGVSPDRVRQFAKNGELGWPIERFYVYSSLEIPIFAAKERKRTGRPKNK